MRFLSAFSFLFILAVFHLSAQYPSTIAPQKPSAPGIIHIDSIFSEGIKDTVKGPWDHLTINSDSRINKLLEIRKEENVRKGGIDGFRLQIFQGAKDEAYRLKSKFLAKYPDQKIYVFFQTPDFKVRIGDFRDRTEAIHLQYLIDRDFPNSLIVEDVINFPELKKENDTEGEL